MSTVSPKARKSKVILPPTDDSFGDETPTGRRKINYAGRRTMQKLLPQDRDFDRFRSCGAHGILVNGRVQIKVKERKRGNNTAGWSGLATCGSVHACPPCAQKIAAVRALEILNAMNAWHQLGHSNTLMTLTARHNKTQTYTQVADAVTKAFQAVITGKAWIGNQKDFGVELEGAEPRLYSSKTNRATGETVKVYTMNRLHFVRVIETTQSDANGWHVHIHASLFHRSGLTDAQIHELSQSIYGRWQAALVREGFDAPTFRHGIDMKRVMKGDTRWVKDYLTKSTYKAPTRSHTASEIAGGTGKKGRWVELEDGSGDKKWVTSRTPFQILEDLTNRFDKKDLQLWTEFVIGSLGRRQVTWSSGLRKLVGMNEEEKTDHEIAAEDAAGIIDIVLTNDQFKIIRHRSEDVLEAREVSRESALDFLAMFEIVPDDVYVDMCSNEYQRQHAEWLKKRKASQQNRRKRSIDKQDAATLASKHVARTVAHQKKTA